MLEHEQLTGHSSSRLEDEDAATLREYWDVTDRCWECGAPDHHAAACPQSIAVAEEALYLCPACNQAGPVTLMADHERRTGHPTSKLGDYDAALIRRRWLQDGHCGRCGSGAHDTGSCPVAAPE